MIIRPRSAGEVDPHGLEPGTGSEGRLIRNALAKVSKADQDAFKADWWSIFDGIEEPPGDKAVGEARRRLEGFCAQWERAYPAAVACLAEDFESLTVHLRSPAEHWKRIRHSNLLSVNRLERALRSQAA